MAPEETFTFVPDGNWNRSIRHEWVSLTICRGCYCLSEMVSRVFGLKRSTKNLFLASKELAEGVGAKIWRFSVCFASCQREILLKLEQTLGPLETQGCYYHSRLYEMAMNDHSTFADKISLANDLKDRRDRHYARALLWHILPNVPKRDRFKILKSDSLNDWLNSDPRGQWCSQNDKALMYMTAKSYICNNSEKYCHWTGQANTIKVPEHPDDILKRVIRNWRGPSLENFDEVSLEYITSKGIESCSNSSRPQPLDNSISPPESAMFGSLVEYSPLKSLSFPDVSERYSPSLEQAEAGHL